MAGRYIDSTHLMQIIPCIQWTPVTLSTLIFTFKVTLILSSQLADGQYWRQYLLIILKKVAGGDSNFSFNHINLNNRHYFFYIQFVRQHNMHSICIEICGKKKLKSSRSIYVRSFLLFSIMPVRKFPPVNDENVTLYQFILADHQRMGIFTMKPIEHYS